MSSNIDIISHNYELYEAVADLVDNSISAKANKVCLNFNIQDLSRDYSGNVVISDNGHGIESSRLDEIIKINYQPDKNRHNDDLGVFGRGLKMPLKFFKKIMIFSKIKNRPINGRQFYLSNNEFKFSKIQEPPIEIKDRVDNIKFGTLIFLSDPTERLYSASQIKDTKFYRFIMQKAKITKNHLSLIFHKYIENNYLKIIYNDNEEIPSISPIPRFIDFQEFGQERIPFKGSEINLNAYFFPISHDAESQIKDYMERSNKDDIDDFGGLYIYRGKRMIQRGGWKNVPIKIKKNNKVRIILNYPTTFDISYGLNHTKTSIEIPNMLQNRIFKYFENALKESQKYRQHTKRVAQASRKQNKKLVTMWLESDGISKFVRNANHPFVKITQSSNNEEIRRLIDNLYDCFMPVNKRPETSLDHIIRSDKELFLMKEISVKTQNIIERDLQEIEPYNTTLKPINTYL